MIKSSEYADLFIADDAIKTLLTRVVKRERGTFPLAERRDAIVRIKVSSDEMSAQATTRKAYGGAPLTAELFSDAIRQAGVQETLCDSSVVAQIVLDKVVNNVPFATGRKLELGKDATFTYLFETESDEGPAVDKTGNIDPYSLQEFLVVDEQTPLLEREPATLGIEGCTVTGKVLKAKNGTDTKFAKDNSGAIPDAENPDVLVSEIKGHPVVIPNGVRVDPTLRVDQVDLRSGNVVFDGSLLINGDATAGALVEATGDIIIKGVVGSATIVAGNDVIINGGIIGPAAHEDDFSTRVTAGGSIEAQFISQAELKIDGDVIVKEYISHCEIRANGEIKVGEGGRGWLFGGSNHGDMGVSATRLGTDANIKTNVSAGCSPEMLTKLAELTEQKDVLTHQIKQLSIVLRKTLPEGDHYDPAKLKKAIVAINQKIEVASTVLDELEEKMEATKEATITVTDTVFPNVTISINEAQMILDREHGGGTFSKAGSSIEWE